MPNPSSELVIPAICVILVVSRMSRGKKKKRIDRGYIMASPSLVMKEKAQSKRNVPG